jgi:sensor histidine kinase YesM
MRQSRLIFGAGTLALCIAGILALATAIACHTDVTEAAPQTPWTPSLLYGGVLWLWWAAVAYLLWQAGSRRPAILQVSAKNIALHLWVGSLVVLLHLGSLHWTLRVMERTWSRSGYEGLRFFEIGRFGLDFLVYILVWTACAMIAMQIATQKEAVQSLELKQQLSAAHLRALQMQLEPHFLFNTLNAITALVELGRQKEAVQTLSHLNAILKTTLARSMPEKVPLSQELEVVENYLAIEQTRFADRLRVEVKVDPAALDSLVPCFLLQPLVENAVRHGIAHCVDEGLIQTSIQRSGDRLLLSVRDNGPGVNGHSKAGQGIGLKNTKERLAYFYGESHELKFIQPELGGFEISINIPYERSGHETQNSHRR